MTRAVMPEDFRLIRMQRIWEVARLHEEHKMWYTRAGVGYSPGKVQEVLPLPSRTGEST